MNEQPVMPLEVVALVLTRGDTVLLAQRPPADRLAGKWEFPGGKVEAGERAEDALVREIAEELGIKIAVTGPLMSVAWREPPVPVNLHAYLGKHLEGEPVTNFHSQLQWAPIDRIIEENLAPADIPVARQLLARRGEIFA